ncbi:MAG: glycosyltransferase [Longimicrobiales bacterium]
MPRLSVLLPCRDAAQYLPECVASLEAQTFTDFEVIAVDDGSVDSTSALLADWARRDARVRVEHANGGGIVAALNRGLTVARATRIARMDADDVAHPERFALQMRLLDEEPVVGCGTRIRYFPRHVVGRGGLRYERWINSSLRPDEIARDVFVECPIPHPTLMIRRTVLEDAGGYRDRGWPEDYDLVLRLWAAGYALMKVPRVLLDWREGANRLSRRDARYGLDAFRRCKLHYLSRTLLRARRELVICGAGPVGKSIARALAERGFHIRAFVDVDPRKLGQTIHGAPVIDYASLGGPNGAVALAAVAGTAARERIRATLTGTGWVEMRDFCAVA